MKTMARWTHDAEICPECRKRWLRDQRLDFALTVLVLASFVLCLWWLL